MKIHSKNIIPKIQRVCKKSNNFPFYLRTFIHNFIGFLILVISTEGYTQQIKSNKIKLIKVEPSQCNDKLSAQYLQDRIISKKIKGDTLFLHLGFSSDCCIEFNVEVAYKSNLLDIDLDNRDRKGVIEYCLCNCCFELRLTILGIKDTTFRAFLKSQEVFLDKEVYKTYPEKFEIVDGDTINRINKYGFKRGFWRTFYEDTMAVQSEIFHDGANDFSEEEMIKEGLWGKYYFKNGNLSMKYDKDTMSHYYSNGILKEKEVLLKDGYILEKYHPNGQMKSNCRETIILVNGTSQKNHSCKYWNEKGEEIKQE